MQGHVRHQVGLLPGNRFRRKYLHWTDIVLKCNFDSVTSVNYNPICQLSCDPLSRFDCTHSFPSVGNLNTISISPFPLNWVPEPLGAYLTSEGLLPGMNPPVLHHVGLLPE